MEDVTHYMQAFEKYINSLKIEVEDEKKEIIESQKKFSNLLNSFSQKAPTNSVINSLFKDDEQEGFVFSKQEEKRKQLAEQRRAEYNEYLEKKEAERFSKKRENEGTRSASPKSILDSVDYERVLAKRKEEEAKFRTVNLGDVLHSSKPILNNSVRKSNSLNGSDHVSVSSRNNGNFPMINLPGAVTNFDDVHSQISAMESRSNLDVLERENARLIEERIARHLEEQRRQMLLEFEKELKKDNKIREEILNMKASIRNQSPQRLNSQPVPEELPKIGRTGGGGEPVRDSYGNLLIMRGLKKGNSLDNGSIMSFPSMQQEPTKDRMALYREELQRQIEEKKRLEALEKAKAKELEDKIAHRIEEQRLQMLQEFENDRKKTDKVQEEFLRQQERLRNLEEFQRRDAEARRKKFVEARPPEQEKPQPVEIVPERSNSPPIPAVRTKVLFEKAIPAVPEVKPENVFSSLAEIRRKIMEEQQKSNNEFKKSYEVMNRRTVQEISDDDDDDILKTSYKYP